MYIEQGREWDRNRSFVRIRFCRPTSAQLSRAVKADEISVVKPTQPLRLAQQSNIKKRLGLLSQNLFNKQSFLAFIVGKLTVIQFVIEPFVCQQGLVIPLLNDLAIFEDKDFIRFLNGRQAMGDDKTGPSLH